MKTASLLIALSVLLIGCEHRTRIESIGRQVVKTNGSVYVHSWTHVDVFEFLSNSIPEGER